jgi:hypothetical protein
LVYPQWWGFKDSLERITEGLQTSKWDTGVAIDSEAFQVDGHDKGTSLIREREGWQGI